MGFSQGDLKALFSVMKNLNRYLQHYKSIGLYRLISIKHLYE